MKGHIRARGPGAWEIKYDIGTDPVTGKRRVRYVSVRGGKREAQRRLTELLGQVQRGYHPSAPNRETVGDYLETWVRLYGLRKPAERLSSAISR